jgi:SAM-dependent methyltransferase
MIFAEGEPQVIVVLQSTTRTEDDALRYVPALAYAPLTRFYDTVMGWTMREETFKRHLVAQARVTAGMRVLDLGCGTGTLTLMIKQRYPGALVTGIDPDQDVIATTSTKAKGAGARLPVSRGVGTSLPYANGTFDRVLSSLVFHHLTLAQKRAALAESYRVLRPGGEIHIADWGRAPNAVMRAAFLPIQLLDGFETTNDNVRGILPELIEEAGFAGAHEPARYGTVFGSVSLYWARKGERRA